MTLPLPLMAPAVADDCLEVSTRDPGRHPPSLTYGLTQFRRGGRRPDRVVLFGRLSAQLGGETNRRSHAAVRSAVRCDAETSGRARSGTTLRPG